MKDRNEIIVDVVGPGFIASDLNRLGHAHEEIVFDKNMHFVSRRNLVSSERYKTEVDQKIASKGIKILKESKSYLLEYDSYLPLSDEEIKYIQDIYQNVDQAGEALGFSNWVASMSFVDLGAGDEPIFWDLYGLK